MATTITMPRFGATMEEGTINSWSVKEGDAVSSGDLLGEIAIEKLTNELLSEVDGIILRLVVKEGETVACGEPILIIGKTGESIESAEGNSPVSASVKSETKTIEDVPADKSVTQKPQTSMEYIEAAQITPKAEILAKELGVDFHFVKGTGRFGMITREDIRAAVDAGLTGGSIPVVAHNPLQAETKKLSQMQSAIARAMDSSLKTTAQTTITMDLDAEKLVGVYKAQKENFNQKNLKLTYTAMLVKIAGMALVEHKTLRTVLEDSQLVTHGEVNIGIAIDIPVGLIVPNIKGVDRLSMEEIARQLADLGTRASKNALKPEELTGGTFTISNLGMFGIKYFTPVLNPSESALLGIGTLSEIPVVRDGGIFVKPIIHLSLTHDHRVVNGAPGARFLQSIQQIANDCDKLFQG